MSETQHQATDRNAAGPAARGRLARLLLMKVPDYRIPKRKALIIGASVLLLGAAYTLVANFYVIHSTRDRVYDSIRDVPGRAVALVLGANSRSTLCENRVSAAAELYRAGKVRHILVSGDNHTRRYDEPTGMKQGLCELGVPERAITCDYAGFRTLDSVVRARKIFGQDKLIIVSQEFHLYRALAIARCNGIDAVAYCADYPPSGYPLRQRVREAAARAVALLDLYVWNRQPRFLGRREAIEL